MEQLVSTGMCLPVARLWASLRAGDEGVHDALKAAMNRPMNISLEATELIGLNLVENDAKVAVE